MRAYSSPRYRGQESPARVSPAVAGLLSVPQPGTARFLCDSWQVPPPASVFVPTHNGRATPLGLLSVCGVTFWSGRNCWVVAM